MATSRKQLVIDDAILRMVLRAVRGINARLETLAVDVIKKAGPRRHFPAQRHTVNHLQGEHYTTSFTDRNTRRGWEKKDKKEAIAGEREG